MPKRRSIQPLDGGASAYMEVLEEIRSFVDSKSTLTKDDLKIWYSKRYGKESDNREKYIQSLFRSGLLQQARGGRIKCTFPQGQNRDRKVIEIIDDHILYFLDMLNDARDGATMEHLKDLGKEKYELGSNEIWRRRYWLASAKTLELRDDGQLYASDLGRRILRERFGYRVRPRRRQSVNAAEFGGQGEGSNHRTLKEYVHKVAEKICKATVEGREEEYRLLSGDEVDVTAWNARKIWHIEVKSCTSNDRDLVRGLYQCVKYAAVGKAMVKAESSGETVKSLLVVESELSEKVRKLASTLGIRVYRLPPVMRRELKELRAAASG